MEIIEKSLYKAQILEVTEDVTIAKCFVADSVAECNEMATEYILRLYRQNVHSEKRYKITGIVLVHSVYVIDNTTTDNET